MQFFVITPVTASGWWPKKLDDSPGSIRPALEFSMVVILMLACSPMAAKAQWGVLMLPGFCLARLSMQRKDPILIFCFVTGWLAWIASQNFLGKNAVFVGLWYGAVLINATGVVCGMCVCDLPIKGRIPNAEVAGIRPFIDITAFLVFLTPDLPPRRREEKKFLTAQMHDR